VLFDFLTIWTLSLLQVHKIKIKYYLKPYKIPASNEYFSSEFCFNLTVLIFNDIDLNQM